MIRGIIAGGLWGAVIGAVMIALISQLAGWRDLSPAVTAETSEPEIAPAVPATPVDRAPAVVAAAERAPKVPGSVPQIEIASGAADEISAPMLDTAPPALPAAETPPVAIATAEETSAPPAAPAAAATSRNAAPVLQVTTAPEADPAPVVAERAEQAPAVAERAPVAQAPVAESAAPAAAGAAEVAQPRRNGDVPVLVVPDQDAVEIAEATPPPAPMPEPVRVEPPVVAETVEETPAPAPSAAPTPAPKALEIAEAPMPASPETDPEPAPEPAVEIADAEAEDGPRVLKIAGNTPSLPGQRVSGLPRIGVAATQSGAGAPAVEAEAAADLPALDRNKVPFEAPAGAGLISVVLIQGDGKALELESLGGLAMPVTVAIPSSLSNAAELASTYRKAGLEIVVIPDLPPHPRAQDVEQALPISLDAIPQAVAVMDGGFQDSRAATASVVAAVAESGHGLLTWPRGFNTAQKLAGEEGVRSALVFRELELEDMGAMSRALAAAALRARQEGGIVVAAPADPLVLQVLQSWSEENRRTDIVLAPLSAILIGS